NGIVFTRSPVSASRRERLWSSRFATQTALPRVAIAPGRAPTGNWSTTASYRGSMTATLFGCTVSSALAVLCPLPPPQARIARPGEGRPGDGRGDDAAQCSDEERSPSAGNRRALSTGGHAQRRVLGEDRLVELLQFLARLEPEFRDQRASIVAVDVERLRLTA